GEEGCIMASSSSSMSKIKDLTKEEILKIENDIKERNFKIQDFKMERIKKKYDFSRYIGKFTKKEDK
ncbi:flagellar biosynthesis protein FliZ, partial [Clostridioides difficile]|nr:flagellar biosynthesis protein FliZ [Clostridioides difficile]EGT4201613.1 flagellar biosynthesis protein FliZ [Clostridioides difficile]